MAQQRHKVALAPGGAQALAQVEKVGKRVLKEEGVVQVACGEQSRVNKAREAGPQPGTWDGACLRN